MTTVPRDWTALMGLVPEVLVARTEMLNSDASQQMRDEAVARYSRLPPPRLLSLHHRAVSI